MRSSEVSLKSQTDVKDSANSFDDAERSQPIAAHNHSVVKASSSSEGWLQVLCGFAILLNSWGLLNTFGVFQEYYSTTLIPNSSDSSISWIGSIGAFLLCFTSMLTGPLFDIGLVRPMILIGSIFIVLGLMMTSLCHTLWQLILAQGISVGLGAGPLFICSVAVIPGYFTERRAFALGVAAAGSSVGGIVYPIVFHRLEPNIGFGWATRVIAFIALGTLIIPCLFLKPCSSPDTNNRRKIVDLSGFREQPFNLFTVAAFAGFCGLYIPFFYISAYALHLGLSPNLAFYMLPILSAGSIPGRLLPGVLADHFDPLSVLALCTSVAALLAFCWIAIGTGTAGLVIWSLLYGAFSGAFVSLQPASVVSITPSIGMIGGRIGTNTFFAALGILVGTPVAGAIVGQTGSWVGLQSFCGAMLMCSAVLLFLTRCSKVGWRLVEKA